MTNSVRRLTAEIANSGKIAGPGAPSTGMTFASDGGPLREAYEQGCGIKGQAMDELASERFGRHIGQGWRRMLRLLVIKMATTGIAGPDPCFGVPT